MFSTLRTPGHLSATNPRFSQSHSLTVVVLRGTEELDVPPVARVGRLAVTGVADVGTDRLGLGGGGRLGLGGRSSTSLGGGASVGGGVSGRRVGGSGVRVSGSSAGGRVLREGGEGEGEKSDEELGGKHCG